jgi:hypothetical protein
VRVFMPRSLLSFSDPSNAFASQRRMVVTLFFMAPSG